MDHERNIGLAIGFGICLHCNREDCIFKIFHFTGFFQCVKGKKKRTCWRAYELHLSLFLNQSSWWISDQLRSLCPCNFQLQHNTHAVGTNQIHTEWVCNISAAAAAKPNNFLGLIRKFLANIFPWPWPWSHLKLQIYINSVIYTCTVHNELKFIMLYYFFDDFRTEQIHRVPVRWRDKFQKCRITREIIAKFLHF